MVAPARAAPLFEGVEAAFEDVRAAKVPVRACLSVTGGRSSTALSTAAV